MVNYSALSVDTPDTDTLIRTPITNFSLCLIESGLRATDIAKLLHVSIPNVSNWSLGRRPIPPKHLYFLCMIFKKPSTEIVGWTDGRLY